jgi:DNA-binding transcriptional LysR family regulator
LLEADLGVKLFERLGRKVKLTAEGFKLLTYAEQMLKLDAEAREIISDSVIPKGTLRIGASESLCISYLPSLLKEYHKCYPGVEIILKLGGAAELCNWLMENTIDVALYMDKQIFSETLKAATVIG